MRFILFVLELMSYDSITSAMEGMGTEESTLIEILCPKSNEEMHTLVAKYEESE